jgi:hypothetical protein
METYESRTLKSFEMWLCVVLRVIPDISKNGTASESSANTWPTTGHIPGDFNIHQYRCENLSSSIIETIWNHLFSVES